MSVGRGSPQAHGVTRRTSAPSALPGVRQMTPWASDPGLSGQPRSGG
jgi:hypothetical protein